MINYIINQTFTIAGRKIYCKVTDSFPSQTENAPYVLMLSGGPGVDHTSTEENVIPFIAHAIENGLNIPHFIFFDQLGCGKSDKAVDPASEYTVPHFTDIAIAVVQAVKTKLQLNKMKLFIEGKSFGGALGMNILSRKPEWLSKNSSIQLKLIVCIVGCAGAGMADYSFNFLYQHYKHSSHFKKILRAQERLFAGDFKDPYDLLKNFWLPLEPVYYTAIQESFFSRMYYRLFSTYVTWLLNISRVLKKMGLMTEDFPIVKSLTESWARTEVLNHFFKTNHSGFNLVETVKQHQSLYKKIPICLIYASEDHIVNPKIAESIHQQLPDSSAAIIFNESHKFSEYSLNILNQINCNLLITGQLENKNLKDPVIIHHAVSEKFNALLSASHQPIRRSSTNLFLSLMPRQLQYENQPKIEEKKEEQIILLERPDDTVTLSRPRRLRR